MSSEHSPPHGPKPKSAIPSHIFNGSSPLSLSTSARDARERDVLNSSIRSSFSARRPAQFDSPEMVGESSSASGPVPAVPSGNAKLVSQAPGEISWY